MLCEHAKNIFYPVYKVVEKAVEKYWSYDQPWGMPHATSHQLNFELWKTSFSVWQPSKFSMHLVAKLGRLEGYNGGRSCGNGAMVGDHVENLAKVEVSATRCAHIIRRSGHPPCQRQSGCDCCHPSNLISKSHIPQHPWMCPVWSWGLLCPRVI